MALTHLSLFSGYGGRRMKLDTSKIADNVAIHCPEKEYVRPLFEAIGISEAEIEKAGKRWDENTCFSFDRKWFYSSYSYCEREGDTIIPFEDLIIPESNLIKALHAVGVGDWLQEGVEFEFEGMTCRFFDDELETNEFGEWGICSEDEYKSLVLCPENIKPLPRWTPEEQKKAKEDLACSAGFKYVSKNAASTPELWKYKPELECDGAWENSDCFGVESRFGYFSLQPGECESLEEIAGGGD